MLNPKSIAVVLLTSYPAWYSGRVKSVGDVDKIRGDLAIQMIRTGKVKGYRVIVGDWASSVEFIDRVDKIGKIILFKREHKGRDLGRRKAYLLAAGFKDTKIILKTEPEKVSIVEKFISQIILPIINREADIVIANRNPILFRETYPGFMWKSEMAGNKVYINLLRRLCKLRQGQNFDIFFGPIAFRNHPRVLRLFLERYKYVSPTVVSTDRYGEPGELSNCYLFPIVKALYPKSQKQNEEYIKNGSIGKFKKKRNGQYIAIIEDLKYFRSYLTKYSDNILNRIYGA
ncbi:MAG: hypothetical protein UU12_C0001G0020 [Candidatus Woesebacteria bacterium GW2011_GWA2_40_7b]|uniref:Glycosyltransferase n=1 Tax=Candidatus Woesebacteria bacterium GW2011_GWA2_40_7b TaxID=1618563 RepID=A0A0G0W887_9BACT|nr:MAG: hypothetical protein UU12_C0001G0020 [Candidatus Woesebacteria bacterium GW2011_GWA2_40_7b]